MKAIGTFILAAILGIAAMIGYFTQESERERLAVKRSFSMFCDGRVSGSSSSDCQFFREADERKVQRTALVVFYLPLVLCCIAVITALVMVKSSSRPQADLNFRRFYEAMESGDLKTMEQMLLAGEVDPNGRSKEGACWLRLCLMADAEAPCELLMRHGADVNLADGSDLSPVEYASESQDRLGAVAKKFLKIFEAANASASPVSADSMIAAAPVQNDSRPEISLPGQLAELAQLYRDGHLSSDQFEAAKARVLTVA